MNTSMLSMAVVSAALAAVLAAAPAATRAAPDQGSGTALMSAVVRDTGVLSPGWGSGVASANRISVGFYSVSFDRGIEGCVPVVTPWLAGFAEIAGQKLTERRYYVQTRNSAGAPADASFSLIVFCAR